MQPQQQQYNMAPPQGQMPQQQAYPQQQQYQQPMQQPAPQQQQYSGVPPPDASPLDFLCYYPKLQVIQKKTCFEIMCGCDANQEYKVKDNEGNNVIISYEESNTCARLCLGVRRPFTMSLQLQDGREIAHVERPYRCEPSCCGNCYLQEMSVFNPDNELIGHIQQRWACMERVFHVSDGEGNLIYEINGPFCRPWTFLVLEGEDGAEVGKIQKKWSGLGKEMFTDADNFSVTFPDNANGKMRSTLLAATFLIDFLFFEKRNNK